MTCIGSNKAQTTPVSHHVLILLTLLLSSRAALEAHSDMFLLAATVVAGAILIADPRDLPRAPLFFILATMIWVLGHAISDGYLNATTLAGHLCRAMVAVFTIAVLQQSAFRLLSLWIVRLSAGGLFVFALGLAFEPLPQFLYDLAPPSFRFSGATIVDGQSTGVWLRANWLFYTVSPERVSQNHGFMWEPAAFAMMAVLGLLLRWFETEGRPSWPDAVLVAAVISTGSTTGYIGLAIVGGYIAISGGTITATLALCMAPFAVWGFVSAGFLLEKIVDEMQAGYAAHMRWSLSRFASFELDMREFWNQPLWGAGLFVEARQTFGLRPPSNNGLSDYLLRYGLIGSLTTVVFLLTSVQRAWRTSAFGLITFTAVMLCFGWSEKFFELPVFYVAMFAGWADQAQPSQAAALDPTLEACDRL